MTSSVEQDIYIYPASDEYPQKPGTDIHWQESLLVHWWDQDNGIGGMHRLAREPNRDGGRSVLFFGVVTREGLRFNRYLNLQSRPDDVLQDGLQVGPSYRYTVGDGPRLVANDEGCELDLRFEDTMPRVDLVPMPADKSFHVLAPSHFEVGGRVRGTVKLQDKTYRIENGLCTRDHSWGQRDWAKLLGHRWVSGWFGPEITFAVGSAQLAKAGLTSFGFISRNGIVRYAKHVDILARTEMDGLSHRGGVIRMEMEDGSVNEIDAYRPINGISFAHHGLTFVQEMCDARLGALEGQLTFEITTRPSDPEHLASVLLRASPKQGWSR
jgi:hypothetical protein